MTSRIEIPLSRTKIILTLIGAILFVVLGVLFVLYPDTFVTRLIRNPEIIRIVGVIGVAFFGLCSYFILRKLADNKPGLIIDQVGITDNSSTVSVGLIEWADIAKISVHQIMSQKFLMIHVHSPEKYLNRLTNPISKRAAAMNHKNYGTPVSIISNSLKIRFDDLEKLVKNYKG